MNNIQGFRRRTGNGLSLDLRGSPQYLSRTLTVVQSTPAPKVEPAIEGLAIQHPEPVLQTELPSIQATTSREIVSFTDEVQYEPAESYDHVSPKSSKKQAVVFASFLVFTFGGIAGYVYLQTNHQSKPSTVIASASSSSAPTVIQAIGTGLSVNSAPAATLGASTEVSSLQTNLGQQATPAPSSAPTKTPGPESFRQYDKYKDEKSALFGDLQVGTGLEAVSGKKVAVVYKGWLTNGKLFDESHLDKPGGKIQPFVFTLGAHQVVAGWDQGVAGMKVGGTRRLIVPAALGYGATGNGVVPGNAIMVFDVQLVDVQQ